jgi:hypothetical protein
MRVADSALTNDINANGAASMGPWQDYLARPPEVAMGSRRWAWRFVIASPAVVLIGLVGASLSNAGAAQASKPVPCPSPTSVLSTVTSTACQTVQQVTAKASAIASTAQKTVQKLSPAAKKPTGSSSGSARGAHQSHGRTQPHARRSASDTRRPAVGTAPTGVGVLLTDWPLALSALSPATQQLIFPKVYPARHTAAQAAGPSSRVPGRLWLLFLIGGLGLAASYFLGWLQLRQRRARTTT